MFVFVFVCFCSLFTCWPSPSFVSWSQRRKASRGVRQKRKEKRERKSRGTKGTKENKEKGEKEENGRKERAKRTTEIERITAAQKRARKTKGATKKGRGGY